MPDYIITQKNSPIREHAVTDSYGSVIYRIRQAFHYMTATFVVTDAADQPVAKIRQQLSLIVPTYKIEIADQPPVWIKRKLCFGVVYTLKGKPWTLCADRNCDGYYLFDEKETILAKIKKDYQRGRHNYILDPQETDPLLLICLTIATDAAMRAISKV